jgi:hypothetical protein
MKRSPSSWLVTERCGLVFTRNDEAVRRYGIFTFHKVGNSAAAAFAAAAAAAAPPSPLPHRAARGAVAALIRKDTRSNVQQEIASHGF